MTKFLLATILVVCAASGITEAKKSNCSNTAGCAIQQDGACL